MITSGVIIDQYDDPSGHVLKHFFKTAHRMPDLFKTAAIANPAVLPDESFALIIEDSGVKLRKYAMHDPPTAAKSAFYFMTCGAKLPEEARKVAAVNLSAAMLEYGLEPPRQMLKAAGNTYTQKENIERAKLIAGKDSGYKKKEAALPKGLMDWSQNRAVNKESAGALGGAKAVVSGYSLRERINRNKGKKAAITKVSNAVDTTGQVPEAHIYERPKPQTSDMYAITKEGSAEYPIDSMDRLLDAITYFGSYEDRFSPADRQEYCTKVAHRADALAVPVPERMRHYASRQPSFQKVAIAIFERSQSIPESDERQTVLSELAKEATAMAPEMLVAVLEEFDKEAGLVEYWDRGIPNPILSVYHDKLATSFEDDDLLWEEGNDRLTSAQLKDFIKSRGAKQLMDSSFSHDTANAFFDNPVQIFQSLPDPHKIEVARLVSDNSDGRDIPHRVVHPNSE